MYIKLDEQKYKNIFAHTSKIKDKELLLEHCDLTKEYLDKILFIKSLNPLIDELIYSIDRKNKDLINL